MSKLLTSFFSFWWIMAPHFIWLIDDTPFCIQRRKKMMTRNALVQKPFIWCRWLFIYMFYGIANIVILTKLQYFSMRVSSSWLVSCKNFSLSTNFQIGRSASSITKALALNKFAHFKRVLEFQAHIKSLNQIIIFFFSHIML